jgi:hypothetical protein
MRRALCLLFVGSVLLATTGCGTYYAEHDRFDTEGKLVEHQKIVFMRNALDSSFKDIHLKFPDGSDLVIGSVDTKADPNAMAAISQGFQAVITIGQTVLKAFVP